MKTWSLLPLTLASSVLLCCPLATAPGFADVIARASPQFTDAELAIIARNESLRRTRESDPWVVKGFLERLGKLDEEAGGAEGKGQDPDIDRYLRSSPEAAHDLLQIIMQAGSAGQADTLKSQANAQGSSDEQSLSLPAGTHIEIVSYDSQSGTFAVSSVAFPGEGLTYATARALRDAIAAAEFQDLLAKPDQLVTRRFTLSKDLAAVFSDAIEEAHDRQEQPSAP